MILDPEILVQKTKVISSLPLVYTRVQEAVNDPHSSNRDLANIISEDPGLAARLLRMSNSPFFGFASKIDTINRAVTVIGTKQLCDLVLATSVMRLFHGVSPELVCMESFWRHSVACGVAARILATYRREPNVERFFVAGLLHDIGRLIIFMQIPEIALKVLQEAHSRAALLYEVESEMLGFDHAAVGGALLTQWWLPEHTVEAVAHHHRPSDSPNEHIDAALVHIADLIVNAMCIGTSGERFVPPLDLRAWERIGLPVSVLAPTLTQLERQYSEAISVIMPETGNENRVARLG